jgi:nuclear transport factor 2 (NTF2) superfamily protein
MTKRYLMFSTTICFFLITLSTAMAGISVPGDYNGDGTQDLAVWRPSNGTWYISTANRSWANKGGAYMVVQWGTQGDIPVPADYDGDGIQELAVWRPSNGTWYISTANRSWSNKGSEYKVIQWGTQGDIPAPADYDGDGIVELAVWRPANGNWYISLDNRSWSGKGAAYKVIQWGRQGDVPVPADYNGQ